MGFADRVALMREGRIEQFDSAWQLYHRPASRYVAGFVGEGTLLPVRRDDAGWSCELGALPDAEAVHVDGAGALILVRPDDLGLDPASPLRARVERVEFRGAEEFVVLALPSGARVHALWPSHDRVAMGEEVGLRWNSPHTVIFPA